MGRTKGALGKKNKTLKEMKTALDQAPEVKKLIKETCKVAAEELKIEPKELTKEQKERQVRLNETLKEIIKRTGKGSVKYAKDMEIRQRDAFGHKEIDDFTNGGIPEGLCSCFWGGKSTGKTTTILDLIAEAQGKGKTCAYVNGERSYDPIWAKKRGIDVDKLIIIEVETLEAGLDAVIKLCREKVADLIVFDSIHGLAPDAELYKGKAEEERSTADIHMALRARALTQFFEMATAFIANAKCAVILVAQTRIDLSGFIKLEHLTGGHALLHFCRMILKFQRGQKADAPTEEVEIDDVDKHGNKMKEKRPIGFDMKIRVDKSQLEGCLEGSEIHIPFFYLDGLK